MGTMHGADGLVELGWAATSLGIGLQMAKHLDWSQGGLWKGLLVVAFAVPAGLVILLLASAIVMGLLILFERFVLRRR